MSEAFDYKIGETYYIKSNTENPFKRKKICAFIKDIKEGYVLYALSPNLKSNLFNNESMKLSEFKKIYTEREV